MAGGARARTASLIEYSHTMSGPNDTDDGWGELLHELGLEQPKRPDPVAQPAPSRLPTNENPRRGPAVEEETGFAEALEDDAEPLAEDTEPFADDSEGMEDAADGPVELDETGEPKKKKRRRRRRKKKGAAPGDPAEVTAGPDESGDEPEDDSQPGYGEEPESEHGESIEEDAPSPEAARELIANWDVPSWETIVSTMLYRPGGR